jgi:hypothetical protein
MFAVDGVVYIVASSDLYRIPEGGDPEELGDVGGHPTILDGELYFSAGETIDKVSLDLSSREVIVPDANDDPYGDPTTGLAVTATDVAWAIEQCIHWRSR